MTPSLETLLDLAEAHCRGETLSLREMATKAGVNRNAIDCRLHTLLRHQYITGYGYANHRRGAKRTIRLTDAGWAALVPYAIQDPRWLFIPVAQLRSP